MHYAQKERERERDSLRGEAMEVPLPAQRPLCGRTIFTNKTHFKIKPFLGFFPRGRIVQSSQSSSWQKDFLVAGVSYQITASADFSRRTRKMSTPRPKSSAPKGFMPKAQVGKNTQKQDQRNNGEKEGPAMPKSSQAAGPNNKALEKKVDTDKEQLSGVHPAKKVEEEREYEFDGKVGEVSSLIKPQAPTKTHQVAENGRIDTINEDVTKSQKLETIAKNVEDGVDRTGFGGVPLDTARSKFVKLNVSIDIDKSKETVTTAKSGVRDALGRTDLEGELLDGLKGDDVRENESIETDKDINRIQSVEPESVKEVNVFESEGKENEDSSLKLKLEMEVNTRNQVLERLAEENFSKGIKMFYYPELVKPDQDIELFLNRGLSTLQNEPDVMVMGAFNDWQWKSFTAKLNKSHLKGDWWSCQVHVHKEAYKMDFVFFNGKDVYDNNDRKDFCITVEGGMDVFQFEDFLLEEKRRELEKLAEEQAERERQAEEQRRIEAEKAASEADRAQARVEVQRKREILQESMKKATKFVEENFSKGIKMFYYPELVKPDQDIELFLNRGFSTLQNEPDVMVKGAFNDWRWKSFTAKLNKSHLKGDWWSCQVHVPKEAYKMDFVFFNGKDVYDNNDRKDFCITVEGGMDVFQFEDFLLEEKHRELEKLAEEQAERERQAEEQRRIEADKAASEADRAQARVEVQRKREILQELMKKATKFVDNVWFIEPSEFNGEDIVRLYYNKSSGPLAHAKDLWIHGGHNNWKDGLSIGARLVSSNRKDGDWWYADVVVPYRAIILDWVFADGPPQHAIVYDNNHRQDFHTIVPKCIPEELYWVEEEHQIYRKLQEDRRLREEAIRAKAERTARMKSEMKERTLKKFLLSQKHVVYTEPLHAQAGNTVTVFYNPTNTVLNGKSEVWFRCSFNRWTHRMGPLPPQKMLPAENGSHVRVTVKVPLDGYMMDFVFSEREDGGIFDNKNGTDYHIPVSGAVVKEPPMHIVHIAVEMAPIAKVGGLGDVVTSLSRAVQDLNHSVDIIFPKYDCLNLSNVKDFQFQKSYSWGGTEIKVWFGKVEGLSVYFLEPQNGLFSTGCLYGCRNDAERFGFFCHAALEFLLQSGFHPDIIHCHDWSSAPVAWLFKDHYVHYGLSKARVVFTIHNLEFGAQFIGKAMAFSDKATTVSHTYSKEVSGNPIIAPHLYKFHGILNGIDPDIWDPYNDKFIPLPYTARNVIEGKRAAKKALQQRLGLKTGDLPLVGIITRLTHQKGIHLIKHALWRTLHRNGQVVLLGSAPDPRIQSDFVNWANQLHSSHGDQARLCLTYDEPLSHLIYAGADFILVPSVFEPCGLTQLTAMRYGSIPVVRKTGGLYDTVFDVDRDKERAEAQGLEPNGFNFDGADASGVDYALNRAISAWYDGRNWFNSLRKRVMEQDWSWNRPALDYVELYRAARK